MTHDLLIELGTEELPPKALKMLSESFHQFIINSLKEQGVSFSATQAYASPRRLAVIIQALAEKQADREEEKLGPAVAAAYDKEGNPSKAALGFAQSNNTHFDQLSRVQTDKGERLAFKQFIAGKETTTLIAGIVEQALAALPIPKRMRWGASRAEFVRPVKWLALVYGKQVIDATILGVRSDEQSFGHRFHAPNAFTVNAANYVDQLKKHYVIADFAERRALILAGVTALAEKENGTAIIPEALLDEVTALVEWPVPLVCSFEERFLAVPQEALISTMQDNQKYFCLVDKQNKLLPRFITVANIASLQENLVIMGNEKVIRPRLTDAAFFFETDKKKTLEQRRENLKTIVFQQKLGSIFDKTERISTLAAYIAEKIAANVTHARRAGELAKSDLVSEMVLEFTELQGLMGYYYALHDGEADDVAKAIRDQYYPAGNNDNMPENAVGNALALADRIDTLIGIFGIGQQPTGTKDPFALRRATLGILRIILQNQLDIDLRDVYQFAFKQFSGIAADTVERALEYSLERLRAIYHEQGYSTEMYLAVAAKKISSPLDFDQRIKAVFEFSKLEQASALAAANKRVANILAKQNQALADVNPDLFVEPAEKQLFATLNDKLAQLNAYQAAHQYTAFLSVLATLKESIDAFFEQVMVMTEDEALRNNRIALLGLLNQQFSFVADIALLAQNK